MAFRLNTDPPTVHVAAPVINLPEQPAPVVNVTVPPGPAPVVNVAVPNGPAPSVQQPSLEARPGESKVVSEYTQFTTATIGKNEVVSGWIYRSSKDTAPYHQFCYLAVGRTGRLELAHDGKPLSSVPVDASVLGVTSTEVEAATKSCRWYTAELRDPTR
jgi:hypothetical protein